MFESSAVRILKEHEYRRGLSDRMLKFGVKCLDDAFTGILPDDLVLVGAPSGAGKTQFCVNVALSNLDIGKRVHFFALEASDTEIERRLKYQMIANFYYSDPDRPLLDNPLRYQNWLIDRCGKKLAPYEERATRYCEGTLGNLFTYYKKGEFNTSKLIETILQIEDETDLIIIDHAHYFDWEGVSESVALKEIVTTARDLALESQRPIILVAHLRKKNQNNKDIAAGIEEFQGSSDLYKVPTKIITVGSGGPLGENKYISYFRMPKNRNDMGVSRYLCETVFDAKRGSYESKYKVGWCNAEKFAEIDRSLLPEWAQRF